MKSHDYNKFAKDYAQLGIKDTFYLGYRDIPTLVKKYVKEKKALDFGCGSGRSTRFLNNLGFETIGVDINKKMLNEAKKVDPKGKYYLLENSRIPYKSSSFDLALMSLVLMEVSSKEKMKKIFRELHKVLKKEGIIIIITDAENMYKHEATSFTYRFPENKNIKSGMQVKLGFRGVDIIFYDYYWSEKDYAEVFSETGFQLLDLLKPLATGEEPFEWYSETQHPHFAIYVLAKNTPKKALT